nr:MAG TPA: stabilization protein [Caudoviricetes sp.]
MGLVSQSVKNLKGGISQQPDVLRFSNQGELQINGWSSETEGLQKRSPTTFVKRLGPVGQYGAKPLVHLVNRDSLEQYYMVFTGQGVSVVDLKGNTYNVRGYNGYANCPAPRTDLRIITVADYTFVANRNKLTAMKSTMTQSGYVGTERRAIINVRGGQYGRTLKININGVTRATLVMPVGDATVTTPPQVQQTDAGWIAAQMSGQITSALGPSGWTSVAGQGWICVTAPAGAKIDTISTEDGYAGQLLNSFIYQVQTFSKLPAQCIDGYLVEITGEASRTGDNYWVRYDAAGQVWRETVKPGIIAGIEPTSMPHALIRAADGQFDWTPLTWADRTCGDDTTNPMPSFIGDSINDIFFFRNRLGFLSGENVVMSRTSKYFYFFPASVSALSDDDPIDVAISHNRVSILKYAVPFSEQLLLWSDQAQFVLSSQGILSSKTIQLDLTTEFDVSDGARPFGIGRGVYFAAPRASYTSLKRYYAVQDVSDVKSAEDVSAHVPSYIENTVFHIHGSGTENFVSMLSDAVENRVYIYKFLYLKEELVQQSWSYWEFGQNNRVLAADCIGSYMYLINERVGVGMSLERIEFTADTVDYIQEPYRAYMDMKKLMTPSSYNEDLNETYVSLSAIYGGVPDYLSVFYTLDPQGVLERHESTNWNADDRIKFVGNRMGTTFVIGREYGFQYEFSKFLIKQTADDGTGSTEDIGRLQLRRAWVNYDASGAFEVNVNNGSSEYVYVMAGGRLGTEATTGQLALGTGQYKFPVTGNAKAQRVTITSFAPVPLNIIGCGWEGNYMRRSSGV